MKMTWKKTQSNTANNAARKRKIVNPNLPFDYANSDTDTSAAAERPKEPEDSRNNGVRNTNAAVSEVDGEKTKNIAQEFEAQGNKLAEVIFFPWLLSGI